MSKSDDNNVKKSASIDLTSIIEDQKLQQEIDSDVQICCSHTSIYGLKYISRITVSIIILIFSCCMIALHVDRDNSIYFSLISSILGYYISINDFIKK